MGAINIKTSGFQRPVFEQPGTEQFTPWVSGTLSFEKENLVFNEWLVPYSKIKSAVFNTSYNFSIARSFLLVSDSNFSYMFKIPGRYRELDFPFKVQREIEGSWWQRYGLYLLIGWVLIFVILGRLTR